MKRLLFDLQGMISIHTTDFCGAQIAISLLQLPGDRNDVRNHSGSVHGCIIHKGVGSRRFIYALLLLLLQLQPIIRQILHNCTDDESHIKKKPSNPSAISPIDVRNLISLTLDVRATVFKTVQHINETLGSATATQFFTLINIKCVKFMTTNKHGNKSA